MTASAQYRHVTAGFLRRAGLLAGILAILAGILGMHVLTGTHSMHPPAAVPPPAAESIHAGSTAAAGHTAHDTSIAIPASDNPDAAGPEQCSCSGSCADAHTMTLPCTPSAKTGSLSAPLPGRTVFGISSTTGAAGTGPGLYSYLPRTPSPGELSISRT